MTDIKCRICYKLLAKIGTFTELEIKCNRCKTINVFMNTESVTPERLEQPISGKHHEPRKC